MNCDCKDWVMSWDQIESAKVMASIHGQQYSGVKFKFCPWCGKEIINKSYEYKPIIVSDGTTPIRKDCWMNGRTTSQEEDKAMSSYVRGRYNSTVIPDTDWQISKGGKYGLGDYKE